MPTMCPEIVFGKVVSFAGVGNSIQPEILKPLRTELRIAHRVRDVPVPEVLLDRSSVVSLIRQLITGRVSQHVRMDREGEFRELAGARYEFARRRRRHRSAALGHEQIGRLRIVAVQLPERTELRTADRMGRGHTVLQSRNMH